MAAENCTSCRKYALTVSLNIWVRMDFPHEVRFSAGIGPAHFPAATTRPLGRGCLPFSPCFEFSCCDILVKMDWRRWASIARLSIRIMCCPNGSRKLLTQKIIIRPYQAGPVYFLHEVQFSAGIGPAHFPADLRNAALSAFEEGAPFMGTALAEYKQCIEAEVVCHFLLTFNY